MNVEETIMQLVHEPYDSMESTIFIAEERLNFILDNETVIKKMIGDALSNIKRDYLFKSLRQQRQLVEEMHKELLTIWDKYEDLKNRHRRLKIQCRPEKTMEKLNETLGYAGYEYRLTKKQL